MSEYPQSDERSGAEERPLHQNWFFYVAGIFLVIAMICFVLSNTLMLHPPGAPSPPSRSAPAPSSGEK